MVDPQRRCSLLLAWRPKSGDRNPCYGSHRHTLHQRLPANEPEPSRSPGCHWGCKENTEPVLLACRCLGSLQDCNRYDNKQRSLYFPAHILSSALHPRHKLAYFQTAGRTQDWIVATEILMRSQFESRYTTTEAGNYGEDSGDQESEDVTEVKTPVRQWHSYWGHF